MVKKIGVFWGIEKKLDDFLVFLGDKKEVYFDFFESILKKGHQPYLILGQENVLEDLFFKKTLKYLGNGRFSELQKSNVQMDVVYDRSGSKFFPGGVDDKRILNNIEFKAFCNDKYEMYKLLNAYMKKTFFVKDFFDMKKVVKENCLSENKKYVLKPVNGLKGIGVKIGYLKDITDIDFDEGSFYILQEFLDTSAGIEGVCAGSHDLRLVFVDNQLIWSMVRLVSDNSKPANIRFGSEIKEVDLSTISLDIKKRVGLVRDLIESKYPGQVYSIDIGVEEGKAFVFEINDVMGFPGIDFKKKQVFFDFLIKKLLNLN